ncbi:hypothetical protein RJ641_007259 [Dillenia turbinata]|uniref:Pentatricopeptide repeat-containing protein n=1 Tax=Dillenia turbinata TaxID=194707 RepID=A0AAN8V0V6_9MAGN
MSPSIVVEVLPWCCGNSQLALKFVDFIGSSYPGFNHSSTSFECSDSCFSEAQANIGCPVFDSLYGEAIDGVFDLLIRTYVQARKVREAAEAFWVLKQRSICPPINVCNILLSGLVKVDWVDLAWEIDGGVVGSGA